MKNNKGQTLYYFLIFTMILVISWAMMLNIAKLIRDRMSMQILADNTALSIATNKARIMNFVGNCNYLIGAVLSLGTRGEFVQMRTYDTDTVAAYYFGDRKENENKELSDDVPTLKNIVEKIQKAQEIAMIEHIAYVYSTYVDLINKGYTPLILPTPVKTPSVKTAEEHFGLKRNMKEIKYKGTINVSINDIDYVYTTMPFKEFKDFLGEEVKKHPFLGAVLGFLFDSVDDLIDYILDLLGLKASYFGSSTRETSPYSWYIIDEEKFYNQKTSVIIRKRRDNRNRPLFASLLNIAYPSLTSFSAAAIYNTKGTMFPKKESNKLGTFTKDGGAPSGIEAVLLAFTTAQTIKLDVQLAAKYGKVGAIAAAAVTGYCGAVYLRMWHACKEGREDSAMNNYLNAKDGGWAAHLVPYHTDQGEEEETPEQAADENDG